MVDVSNRRIRFLRDRYVAAGLSRSDANHRAMLTYTSYVGYWRIHASLPVARPAEVARYVEHLTTTLIPPPHEPGGHPGYADELVGLAQATLHDEHGPIGFAAQSLLIAQR